MSENLAGKALADLASLSGGYVASEPVAAADGGGDAIMALVEGVEPQAVYVTPGGADAILTKLGAAARSLVADVTTKAGREAIASNAYRVARSKTYLDTLGKNFVADLKAQTVAVDKVRKRIRDDLDALRDEVRRPLTEIEEREAARAEAMNDRIQGFREQGLDLACLRLSGLVQRRAVLDAIPEPTKEDFAEFFDLAVAARRGAMDAIDAAIAAAEAAEAAEKERLAAVEAARAEAEAKRIEAARKEAEAEAERRAEAKRAALERELAETKAREEKAALDAKAREEALRKKLEAKTSQAPAAAPPAVPGDASRRRAVLWLATALRREWPVTSDAANEIAERLVSQIADGLAFGLRLSD